MPADSTGTATPAPPLGAEYADTASAAYRAALQVVESVEPRIAAATRKELADQRDSLKLIASENYASPAVLLAMGSWLSDKYAEGTVGHRFYAGCQNVDTVESVAAEHARELFGAPYAYVQPHSGIDANLVAYWAILAARSKRRTWPSLASSTSTTSPNRTGKRCGTSSAASGCWECRWTPGATSPTVSGPTSPARCFINAAMAPTRKPGCWITTRSPWPHGIQAADPGRRILCLPAADQLRHDA
ncbi:serine hydroxymethyltransferase family protein [Mycobacterium xenopi 3993]|nr:serine hydroxymethyltransferase family protein [Mycobacterium xenopi 3993]